MIICRETLKRNQERLAQSLGGPMHHRWFGRNTDTARAATEGVLPFNHLGTIPTKVGRSGIDWSGQHHRHQEWRAQLNRFFTLPALAAEYEASGDEVYAETARDFLNDWMAAHPVGETWQKPDYDNTLNLAIRTQMWTTTLARFAFSHAFDEALIDRMIESIGAQYRFLLDHMATHMNWRIAQAHSLLYSGVLLDGYPPADGWRSRAVHMLNDAFFRQIMPDGCHDERNPGYHTWMTSVFESLWRLGNAQPELGLRMDAARIALMHDYALSVLAPNGGTNGMHDCKPPLYDERGESFNRARSRFRKDAGLPDTMPPLSHWFPYAGQALLRDSWEADATYVTFDATVWGGGHCHLSRNSIQVMPYGRPLLVDPGTLTYEGSDPKSAHGKSTRAHNTVNFNGMNQACSNPDTRFETLPGYDLAISRYDAGYWPGAFRWSFDQGHGSGRFGEHHRTMLWVRDRAIFVIDHILHTEKAGGPDIESNWQFADVALHLDAAAARAVTQTADANLMLLFAQQPDNAAFSVHCGENDPPRGWLPGNSGAYVAAPQVCLTLPEHTPRDTHLVTVLIPFRGTAAPGVKVVESRSPEDRGHGLVRLQWDNGEQDELWWRGRLATALDDLGPFDTDGGLLYLRRPAGDAPVNGLAVDATFVAPYAPTPEGAPRMIVF